KGLGEFVTRDGLSTSSVGIAAFPQLDQLVVELWLTEPKVTYPPKETQIRRYNWQGKLVADSRLPGYSPQLSPDGKLVAYSQSLGMLGSAVVVQELNGREPLFRLTGGLYPQWRADSKAILLESSQGYQLLTTDGTLSPAPPNPGNGRYNPFITFHPSPDDANLYILESAVIDQTGRTVHSMKTADQNLRIVQPRWGATAKVLSFIAMIPGGKGYEGDLWNWIMPRVQKAPFPAKQALQVADPAGECLNLRAEAGKSGKLIRCLPTGTRLELPEAKDYWSLWAWKEDGVWLQVKTEKGEQGWVSAGTHSITYSD
ncbi:MAG: SH3 domain-containing protein, partial [Mycobacterium leprae]